MYQNQGLTEDGKTLIATSQNQVDQLADSIAKFAAEPANKPPELTESVIPAERISDDFNFNGFELLPGPYKVLIILRPQRQQDGTITPPLQVEFGCQESEWRGFARQALHQGINNSTILSSDNEVLSGFTVYANSPNGSDPVKIGFLFNQVVSLLPYKEVIAGLDEKNANAKRVWRRTMQERQAKKAQEKRNRRNK